jgi:hypothetical protein
MVKKFNVKEYIIFILVICLEMDMINVFAKLHPISKLRFDIYHYILLYDYTYIVN